MTTLSSLHQGTISFFQNTFQNINDSIPVMNSDIGEMLKTLTFKTNPSTNSSFICVSGFWILFVLLVLGVIVVLMTGQKQCSIQTTKEWSESALYDHEERRKKENKNLTILGMVLFSILLGIFFWSHDLITYFRFLFPGEESQGFWKDISTIKGFLGPLCYGVLFCSIIAVLYSFWLTRRILAKSDGNPSMVRIARAIQEGASAYLSRQYRSIFFVGLLMCGALWYLFDNHLITYGFMVGAFCSALSGYVGMFISVRGNVRTTQGARELICPDGKEQIQCGIQNLEEEKSYRQRRLTQAFNIALHSGAVTGFLVNGLALFVLGAFFLLFTTTLQGLYHVRDVMEGLIALGFGSSLISVFARLGGGIFTKGADVGADLVGKIEAGIPEDDPRNPAVIADNVGDNVGDCAGMSADLFETYVVTFVASLQAAFFLALKNPHFSALFSKENLIGTYGYIEQLWTLASLMVIPLGIGMIGLVSSIFGMAFMGLRKSIMGAMYKGLVASMIFFAFGSYILFYSVPGMKELLSEFQLTPFALMICILTGLMTTGLLFWLTEYYTSTSYRPVRSIAYASQTGAGTNVIQGLAVSMEACFFPVVVIGAAILISFYYGGLFGISMAATAMLSLMSIIITIDAYGPVTDNGGGIAEMAGLPSDVRDITDELDAVGNTTKAVTKGYAIGSAALAVLVLFGAYVEDVSYYLGIENLFFDLRNPIVMVGLIVGGAIPYVFSALSMKAVGKAAGSIVIEVRRQFKEIKNIMNYGQNKDDHSEEGKPDYGKAVDLLTKASIRTMIAPSLLPIVFTTVLYFGSQKIFTFLSDGGAEGLLKAKENAALMLGGALLGLIITGFFLAISMTSGGGAWDNAKKYIELGNYGGKGSAAHNAAVVGDTVGDPYKDTAGPAINPLIKISILVAFFLLAFS